VVSAKGIQVDQSKVEEIQTWPELKTFMEMRSCHGMASFTKRFIRNFSSVMAPITKYIKKGFCK